MTATALGTRTILLVDDERDVRNVVALMLRRAGYSVLEAADAGEALQLAGDADLLLTDLTLRKESGADLAERLSALRPGVPVLFMSGSGHGESIAPSAFLAKPFSPEALFRKVREALGS